MIFAYATSMNAQSSKMMTKAKEEVQKLNDKLKAADASLVLSPAQEEASYEICLQAYNQMQKNWSNKNLSKEEKQAANKPIRKEMNKTLRKDILTKDQRQALKSKEED